VFPESDRAGDVLAVLREFMKQEGVRVLSGHDITALDAEDGRILRATGPGEKLHPLHRGPLLPGNRVHGRRP